MRKNHARLQLPAMSCSCCHWLGYTPLSHSSTSISLLWQMLLKYQCFLSLRTSIFQSNEQHQARVNSRMSCLAPEHKIWEIFHGYNPHTQFCCSTHECLERSEKVEKHYLPFRYKIYCQEALFVIHFFNHWLGFVHNRSDNDLQILDNDKLTLHLLHHNQFDTSIKLMQVNQRDEQKGNTRTGWNRYVQLPMLSSLALSSYRSC